MSDSFIDKDGVYHALSAYSQDDLIAPNLVTFDNEVVDKFNKRSAFNCVLPTGHTASLSFENVGLASDAIAAYLREDLGLKAGDVVGLMSLNILSYPVVIFGVLKAGLKLTNINPLYTADEVNHQLKDSGAKALFMIDIFADKMVESTADTSVTHVVSLSLLDLFPTLQRKLLGFVLKYLKRMIPSFGRPIDGDFASVLKAGMQRVFDGADIKSYTKGVNPDDTAILQYTGGTTGRSKGAELTHTNILNDISQFTLKNADILDNDQHTLLLILPLYHIYALAVGCIGVMRTGSNIVLIPIPRPMTAIKHAFEQFRITVLPAVNTLYLSLLEQDWFQKNPPKSLRVCLSGAAPLQEATASAWKELTGAEIYEGYGLTESSGVVAGMRFEGVPKRGTCGKLIAGTKARIIGDNGQDMPIGERGELWVSGLQMTKGYLNKPEVNAEAFDGEWFKTGDVAKFDEEGYLYIVDRIKDMVIVSGFNVFPADVEDTITQFDKVLDAAVVGVPDGKTGEKVVAYIVVQDDSCTEDDVIVHCREHLTAYKVPKVIRFVEELPKSPVGKVLRRKLRGQALSENL